MSGGPGLRAGPIAWLVGLAFAASASAALLTAFGGGDRWSATAGSDSTSYSAIGYRGAVEFLNGSGIRAVRNDDPLIPALGPDAALLLVEPDVSPDAPKGGALLAHVLATAAARGRPTIVVLPKWIASPSPTHRHHVGGVTLRSDDEAALVAAAVSGLDAKTFAFETADGKEAWYRAESSWGSVYGVRLPRTRVLRPNAALTPLVSSPHGSLVASVARAGAPPVYLVADADLFDNQGLGKEDHAALLADLVAQIDGVRTIVFDEVCHGRLHRGALVASLLRAPALPLTLQTLLVALLAAWAWSGPFGTPRDAVPASTGGREAFVGTTARLIVGAPNEGMSLERYWRYACDDVAEALHISAVSNRSRLDKLAAASAARGATGDPRALADEVTEAADGPPRPETWIAVAAKVHRWRREMLHGTRTPS